MTAYTIFQTVVTAFTVYNLVRCALILREMRKDNQKLIDMLNQKTV
jgi:hypothetical protein